MSIFFEPGLSQIISGLNKNMRQQDADIKLQVGCIQCMAMAPEKDYLMPPMPPNVMPENHHMPIKY